MARNICSAVLFGIIEGITEWLPVSSTGHLILLDRFLDFPVRAEFFELFEVVIQLGAMCAVPLLFWRKLNPFCGDMAHRRETLSLWGKIALATLPAALAGFFLDDLLDAYLYNALVVAIALVFYGVLFLLLEKKPRHAPPVVETEAISYRAALLVGGVQTLALIPGTSRSGSTILGGMLAGLSRPVAAEFSFFLGVPTMCGAGLLKSVKFISSGARLSGEEWLLLAAGTLTAFLISLAVIRYLTAFVRRRSFAAFGVYRIALGALVLLLIH